MACRMKKQVLPYFLGELCEEEKEVIQNHVETCPECGGLLEEFEETGRLLKRRMFPELPDGVAKECLQKIGSETRPWRGASVLEKLLDRFTLRPKVVWRWAVLVVVFCSGLCLGKFLFDPPTWLERYERMVRSREMSGRIDENWSLRNYLLSVETLFLDLANMDDPALLDEEDWIMEREIAHEILSRTRRMKDVAEDGNPELYRLVLEIEWVLEDVLGSAEVNLADLSKDVRQSIDERRLLAKIHNYIS